MKYSIKINKLNWLSFAAMLLIVVTSCTKNFDELNTPQNQIAVEKLDATLLGQTFARAQYQNMGILGFSYLWHSVLYSDRYSQYSSNFHPAFQSDQYQVSPAHIAETWARFYVNVATPVSFVEKFAKENNMPLENAVAKIWRVEAFHRITDQFGPIVYSEFGNGKTSVNYDSQQAIYADFFKTLDEAEATLKQNPGKNAFGVNDLVYNGSVDKWRILANSLRLRLAMRVAYVSPALAKTEAEKAVAAGVMTTNSDNANVATSVNSTNGLSQSTALEEWRMSASMYSVLEGFKDPRMAVYMAPRFDGGPARGLRNGLPLALRDAAIRNTYSPIGNRWRPIVPGLYGAAGINAPMAVLSSAECYFLRAEGALRGWNMLGTAANLYNEGIKMSISSITSASASEIATYTNSTSLPVSINDPWNSPRMTNIPVLYQSSGSFERQLEQIITQKWIALFPDGWEAWSERRRTGYPVGYALIESLHPKLNKFQMVRRLQFSPNELTANAAGLKSGIAHLNGADDNDTRLWWDAKPLSSYPIPAN